MVLCVTHLFVYFIGLFYYRSNFICDFCFNVAPLPAPVRAHFSCGRLIRSFTCESDLMRLGIIGILIWLISLIYICSMTPIVRFSKFSADLL